MQKCLTPKICAPLVLLMLVVGLSFNQAGTSSAQPGSSRAQFGAADANTRSDSLNASDYLGPRSAHQQVSPNDAYGARFFRVECAFSHFGYHDFVTAPGEKGKAPLRMFFGNTATSADSSYLSLLDTGASTCSGGPLDRSAYVMPAVLNEHHQAVVPSYFIAHYNTVQWRGGYVPEVHAFPPGLTLSSGDRLAAWPQDASSALRSVEFGCDVGERGDDQLAVTRSATIPACDSSSSGASSVKMTVRFPFCWDANNLTSTPGGNPHVVFPYESFHATECPQSHPVLLPSIEYVAFLDVPAGADTSSWYLSTDVRPDSSRVDGGTTMHGDWRGGWHRETLNRWIAGCSNVADAHCAQGLLGTDAQTPGLRRIEPAFGPYNSFEVADPAELLALCPGKQLAPNAPQMIAWCGLDGSPAARASASQVPNAPAAPSPDAKTPEPPAAPAPPAEPVQPAPNQDRGSGPEAYDTAWELSYKATQGEITQYFDHLRDAGFDGTWFSLLPFGAAFDVKAPGLQEPIANRPAKDPAGQVALSAQYTQRVQWILDQAAARGLRVGMVVAWARANTCKNAMITENNAQGFGKRAAEAFAGSPAIGYWVLGGDISEAECGARLGRTSQALAAGLDAGGATQRVAFHTGAGQNNYLAFHSEPWLDAQAVQTGHCQDGATMGAKLRSTVAAATKPVILAESRYYQLAPPWRGCLHNPSNPVDANAIGSDVQAALDAGVAAVLYGDGLRYQWCEDKTKIVSPSYRCASGIASTFNTPGERAFLEKFRR